MKVLQINASCGKGSTGRIASAIHSLVVSGGGKCKVGYAHSISADFPGEDAIRISRKPGYFLHNALSKITGRAGFHSSLETMRFLRRLDDFAPDIVHLHNVHGYYINVGMLLRHLAEKKIPVVWTLHDCWPFTGGCPYFDGCGCEKWKTCCGSCPSLKSYPQSFVVDATRRNFKEKKALVESLENVTFVPVSDWLAGIASESFIGSCWLHVIKNGIDTSMFSPVKSDLRSRLGIPEDRFVVLGVASPWSRRKGLADMIELAGMMPDVQVILVGLTEDQKKSIPTSVIGVGRTDSERELAEYYSIAGVFANPTYSDNYPTTNLEAMACGTPVVTYRTGGSVEAVKDSGWIVPRASVDGLADVVRSVAAMDADEYGKLRLRCREIAVREFDRDHCYAKYLELYRTILENR